MAKTLSPILVLLIVVSGCAESQPQSDAGRRLQNAPAPDTRSAENSQNDAVHRLEERAVELWLNAMTAPVPSVDRLPEDVNPELEDIFILLLEQMSAVQVLEAMIASHPVTDEMHLARVKKLLDLMRQESNLLTQWIDSGQLKPLRVIDEMKLLTVKIEDTIASMPGGPEAVRKANAP